MELVGNVGLTQYSEEAVLLVLLILLKNAIKKPQNPDVWLKTRKLGGSNEASIIRILYCIALPKYRSHVKKAFRTRTVN